MYILVFCLFLLFFPSKINASLQNTSICTTMLALRCLAAVMSLDDYDDDGGGGGGGDDEDDDDDDDGDDEPPRAFA